MNMEVEKGRIVSNELFQELMLKMMDSIEELKSVVAVQNERLDQYNKQLEIHIKRTQQLEIIAEAATEQAHAAVDIAKTQAERLELIKSSIDSVSDMSKNNEKFIEANKSGIITASNFFSWLKHTGTIIASLATLSAGIWAIFTYFFK
jgi:hypothetical protein